MVEHSLSTHIALDFHPKYCKKKLHEMLQSIQKMKTEKGTLYFFFVLFLSVMGIEPRILHMLGKFSTTGLQPHLRILGPMREKRINNKGKHKAGISSLVSTVLSNYSPSSAPS